jgi:hypothetical protein
VIDTIRFSIPTTVEQSRKIMSWCEQVASKKPAGDIWLKYFKGSLELGSYDSNINFFALDESTIFVEFSVTKYFQLHNISTISFEQVLEALQGFSDKLNEQVNGIGSYKDWTIVRIDLCCSLKIPNQASQVLDLLSNLTFPRKKKSTYESSVMFVGSEYSIKFYLKQPEFVKHDFLRINKVFGEDYAYNLFQLSTDVLRYEITLRHRQIIRWLKGDKFTLLNEDMVRLYLGDKLKIITKLGSELMDERLVLQKLRDNLSRELAIKVYWFYKAFYSDDKDLRSTASKALLGKDLYYRYIRIMRKLDIKPPRVSKSNTSKIDLSINGNNVLWS